MIRINKKLIKDLVKARQTRIFILAYLGISSAIFIHAYIQYYFDVKLGAEDHTLFDYIWCGYTTASTTGYGDISSVSIPARIATIIIMYHIVIGLFTWFIGSLIEIFLNFKERRLKGMHNSQQKNGIVIFNYPGQEKLETLIAEFRKVKENIPVCVIDPNIEELPLQIIELKEVHYVHQKVISRDALKAANIEDAKWIFIFPINDDDSDSDALTYAIYQNLSQITYTNENVRIIPWVVSPANKHLFKKEQHSIVMGDLQVKLMVQEATDKFVSKAIDVLLKNSVDANPVSISAQNISHLNWGALQYGIWKYNEERESEKTLNLLALIHKEQALWNPPNKMQIHKEDSILIAAFPKYNWDEIEKEILSYTEEVRSKK